VPCGSCRKQIACAGSILIHHAIKCCHPPILWMVKDAYSTMLEAGVFRSVSLAHLGPKERQACMRRLEIDVTAGQECCVIKHNAPTRAWWLWAAKELPHCPAILPVLAPTPEVVWDHLLDPAGLLKAHEEKEKGEAKPKGAGKKGEKRQPGAGHNVKGAEPGKEAALDLSPVFRLMGELCQETEVYLEVLAYCVNILFEQDQRPVRGSTQGREVVAMLSFSRSGHDDGPGSCRADPIDLYVRG
jgi:hypothetical protein